MKRILVIVASFMFVLLSGCGESSGDVGFLKSEEEHQEESTNDRCVEKFDIEDDVWSTSLSENSYIKNQICDYAVDLFDTYDIEMSCSVRYNSRLNHFEITLSEKSNAWDFDVAISGCKFKLTTEGPFSAIITDMGFWTMDRCLCKEENGGVYYREAKSDAEVESSSSSEESDDMEVSSSSEKIQSSSSSEKNQSSSSSKKKQSSSSSEKKGSSSSSEKQQSSSSKQVVVAPIEDYEFVEINSQYWMTRDLHVFVEGSRCYDDDPSNCERYGRLYTWAQAMAIDEKYNSEELGEISLPYQGICPEGTHLPSYGEWEDLFDFVNEHPEYKSYFMNQMGGAYDYHEYYRSLEEESLFWSSTEYEITDSSDKYEYAWLWAFHDDSVTVSDNGHKITGAYIRCIKNDAP